MWRNLLYPQDRDLIHALIFANKIAEGLIH